MTVLTELRAGITQALRDAGGLMPPGFTAVEYVGEAITPPCAVVVPADPYLRTFYDRPDPRLPFSGPCIVAIDVLLLTTREAAATEAGLADQIIEGAMEALSEYDVARVRRPGVVTLSGSKFIGSVLTIETTEAL